MGIWLVPSFLTVISSRDHWYFDVYMLWSYLACWLWKVSFLIVFPFISLLRLILCDFALGFHGSFFDWKLLLLFKTSSNNADTCSSTYYKRCCVTAIWFILLILPVTWSLFAFECYVGKEMKKSKLRFKQMFLPSISSVTNKNNELWKTVRLTSFQKPQFQSVLIFFMFSHLYLLLYLLSHLYHLLMS